MPEFSTRWIESGPITCEDSSSASRLVTTCFVSWSPATAAPTTAASPNHCQGPAARERSATETARPWVEDPMRTSGWFEPGAGPGSPAGVGEGGGVAASSGTVGHPLVLDAKGGRRPGEQPFARDRLAAA